MKQLNLLSGLKWALFFLSINTLIAVAAYCFWCTTFDETGCSVRAGTYWIRVHPVFPDFIVYLPILGFAIGIFAHLMPEMPSVLKGLLGWVLVILLIAVFVDWGLPEIVSPLRN